jgi:hypothetical protein
MCRGLCPLPLTLHTRKVDATARAGVASSVGGVGAKVAVALIVCAGADGRACDDRTTAHGPDGFCRTPPRLATLSGETRPEEASPGGFFSEIGTRRIGGLDGGADQEMRGEGPRLGCRSGPLGSTPLNVHGNRLDNAAGSGCQ